MHYVTIMVFILAGAILLTLLKYQTIVKPNILFSVLWIAGALFMNINFVGIHEISNETNVYIILSLVMFNIAYFLTSGSVHLRYDIGELRNVFSLDKYWHSILIINFSMIAICIPYFIKMFRILLFQSFYQVRVSVYNYSNFYELLMSKVIFLPMYAFFNIVLMLCVVELTLGEKNFKLYALTIFDAAFYSLITGSRNFIAKFFVYFLVAFLISNSMLKKKRKLDLKLVTLGIIVAVILNAAIKARSLASLSPLENIIVYLFGGIAYFDQITHSSLYAAENAISLYGQGTLAWIVSPFLYLLSLLSIIPDITAESIIGKVSGNGIYISNKFNFNALTTAMYPMWRDFKGVGIALGMAFFAWIVARREKKVQKEFSIYNFFMYFSFVIAIAESTQLYDMLYVRFSVQILLIYLLFGNHKVKFKFKIL